MQKTYGRHAALVWRIPVSILAVGAVTLFGSEAAAVNATTAGFGYLMVVLGIATRWGLVESVVASVAGMVCFNYFFLPPVGRLTVTDPQNWVALLAFLATALVASQLSEGVKRQAREAKERQKETERLYALSRAILLTTIGQPIATQAVQQIAQIFECPTVMLYDSVTREISKGGAEELPGLEEDLRQAVIQGNVRVDAGDGVHIAAITLGGHPIGGLALKGLELSDGAFQALLNLVAIALERVRTEEVANRAEVARQSEEFKSTMLDAIAHEFKTPLTSVKAAVTSLLDSPGALPAASRELATIINEEADRLSLLVTEAVRISQIEAGKIYLAKEHIVVGDLVRRVVDQIAPRAEGRELRVETGDIPAVLVDSELIGLALRQLLDNGVKYSPAGTALDVTAEFGEGQVTLKVRDHGPGIPERDRERIFDKFYRRSRAKDGVPGTGLGLYIAREIARAHGGELMVGEAPGGGAEFRMTIPAAEEA